ncbi:DUF6412 domain-containing protein [Nocardia sp. NBC_00565]|uniref:DUF6412 domain-containing protein n=1 Tax=Nocardia sp. NBC_00565 TaxID=2975993 RepID=UPI002E81C20D|nr:DUF6412 domain-containing protein [Nocardia sp. NBC_00565]WUC05408.1 DUF6412 domain-containing protein [Nocardia sp. NBC_00565]
MFSRVHLLAFAVFALVVPALALAAAPTNEPAALAAFGVIAAALVFALLSVRSTQLLPLALAHSGPPPSAQRRRRGSFLRQSNPDTAGRPRPRAPGSVAA